jgi:hypothetical protein
MLDYSVIPVLATLVPKNNVVSRHGGIWTLFLEDVTFLRTLAEGGFGEVDVINVSPCGLSCRVLHGGDRNEQEQNKKQRAEALHSFLQVVFIGFG